jgi:hypothetical protein
MQAYHTLAYVRQMSSPGHACTKLACVSHAELVINFASPDIIYLYNTYNHGIQIYWMKTCLMMCASERSIPGLNKSPQA